MKVNFKEFSMKKNQYGEYTASRTLMMGARLEAAYAELLKEQDVFNFESGVHRILMSMVTVVTDSYLDELAKIAIALKAVKKKSNDKEGDEAPMIIGALLMKLYRDTPILLEANGIKIPETVELMMGEIAFSKVIEAAEADTENNGVLGILDKDVKKMVFGITEKQIFLITMRSDIMKSIMIMLEYPITLERDKLEKENKELAAELKKKETAANNLKVKNEKLITKLNAAQAKKPKVEVEVKEVDTYKPMYEALEAENFELEKKNQSLLERLNRIESTFAYESKTKLELDIIAMQEVREAKAETYDLSGYKVLVVGDERVYINGEFKLADTRKNPKAVNNCGNADIVVVLTSFIAHSDYYMVKNFCKKFGIKFAHCNVNNINVSKIDNAIKQCVMETINK